MSINEDLIKALASMTSDELPSLTASRNGHDPAHDVPGWELCIAPGEPPHGLRRFDEQVTHEALEAIEIIEADGVPQGAMFRIVLFNGAERTRYVPTDVIVARDVAKELLDATGVAWTPAIANELRDYFSDVLRTQGIPRQHGIERPRWEGDNLLVPGPDLRIIPRSGGAFLTAYGRTAGDEDQARADWRLVLANAIEHPKLAIVMGSAAISPFLGKLNQRAFVQHSWADSRVGKTKGMEIAVSIFGDPEILGSTTWNTTKNAALERMQGANILPVALDETGAAGAFKDELIEAVVFGAASGQGRGRARAGGGLREDSHWRLVLMSTGERRLTTSSGLSGTRARVLEIEGPLTETGAQIEEIHELVCGDRIQNIPGAYGWPLVWMAANPHIEDAGKDYRDIAAAIVTDSDSMTRTVEGLVVLATVGLRALARACGCEDVVTLEVAKQIAFTVADQQRGKLTAEGISAADRLYDALTERVSRRPWAYPPSNEKVESGREREGATLSDGTGFFSKTVADVAKEIKLDDPMPALRGLAKDGRLLLPDHADRATRLTQARWIQSKTTKVYVLATESSSEEE